MKIPDKPLNTHFWLAVAAIALAGGLILGRATGISDDLKSYSGALGTAAVYDSARREVRNLDMDLRGIDLQFDDGEFRELDEEIDAL